MLIFISMNLSNRDELYKELIVIYNFKRLHSIAFSTNNGGYRIDCKELYLDNNRNWTSSLNSFTLNIDKFKQSIITRMRKGEIDITILYIKSEINILSTYFYIEDIYISKIIESNE